LYVLSHLIVKTARMMTKIASFFAEMKHFSGFQGIAKRRSGV
jgi:hypothetical protein